MTKENPKNSTKPLIEKLCSIVAKKSTQLPRLPNAQELLQVRKGLRKKNVPILDLLPQKFEYSGIGWFERLLEDEEIFIVWKIEGGDEKRASFLEMCNNPENELDRLEFGWMIANFARIDGEKYLSQMRPISYEDNHQNEFNRQYEQQKRHFQKLENDWWHWAVVKSGHMKFSS